MEQNDYKERLVAIINTLDKLSRIGALHISGISEIQQFSGCIGLLNQIIDEIEQNSRAATMDLK